jgi:hypothetical protein
MCFITWKAYSERDLKIITDEDQNIIDITEGRLKACRETQRQIRADAAAGNEEAKAWVENKSHSCSDTNQETTKARCEARGGTVVECDFKCGTVRKGLKWCQLLCLNPDCNAKKTLVPGKNWLQTCNATLPTQTFMCRGGCSTKHETEFGKMLKYEKSPCGYIKGDAGSDAFPLSDTDTRPKFACKFWEFCHCTRHAELGKKLYCEKVSKHPIWQESPRESWRSKLPISRVLIAIVVQLYNIL